MAKGYLYDNGDELITREDVNEVPDSSTASAGDILELDSNKKPKWTTPSGGGGGNNIIYVTVCYYDNEFRAYFFDREGNQVSLSEIKEMDDISPVFFVLPTSYTRVSGWDEVEMDNFTGPLGICTQVAVGQTWLYFTIDNTTYAVDSETWTGTNTYLIGVGQQ